MWKKILFQNENYSNLNETIHQTLKTEFQFFKDNLSFPNLKENLLLDNWYNLDKTQKELLIFIKNLWSELNSISLKAMPAHDARHAIFKVPAFSIKYLNYEGISGYQKLGVVGALCHDWGQLQ